jgi:hypothetical protein
MKDYDDAIQKYFKMKVKYEKQVKNDPNSNICMVCNRNNGMIFSFRDNIYSLQCGNRNDPCSLDIRIRRGIYSSLSDVIQEKIKEQQTLRDRIIEIKVQFIFQEISETEMVATFEDTNRKWKELSKEIHVLQQNIIQNEESYKKERTQFEEQIQRNVTDIKSVIDEYKSSKNMEYIHNVIQQYKDEIMPLQDQMREYKQIEYIKKGDTIQRDNHFYKDNKNMIILSKPEVLSFNVKKKKEKQELKDVILSIPEINELPDDDVETEFTSSEYIANVPKKVENVYTDDVVFLFHSKSRKVPLPGKGIGELISSDKVTDYNELAAIKNWRAMLSDGYTSPFKLHGMKWNSVEHYKQAVKFKNKSKGLYHLFSLDSNSELSKDVLMAVGMGSKLGKYKGKRIRPKDIKPDTTLNTSIEQYRARYAKFTQNDNLRDVLLKTKDAKLLNKTREMEEDLIVIRSII